MTRRIKFTLLSLLALGALGAAIFAVPDLRWRAIVVARKVVGQLIDVTWADLGDIARPKSHFDLKKLAASGNPFATINNARNTTADQQLGHDLFALNCTKCHGDAASGGAGPRLVGRSLKHGDSDWAIYRTITRGVPGTAMQGGLLPRSDVWRVIAYLRALNDTARAAAVDHGDGNVLARLGPIDEVSGAALLQVGNTPGGWLLPSGAYDGQRYARDGQINAANVTRLAAQWIMQFPPADAPNETTPIVDGRYMYVTLPPSTVVALDAQTGEQLWQFARPMPPDLRLCCLSTNRGVALLGRRVYVETLDAHLIALDATTGAVLWDTTVANYQEGYSLTSAPLVIGDIIVTGIAGGDHPIRGFINAYDAATGVLRWHFKAIPEPGEPGHETWGGDSWKIGGAGTWGVGAYDPKLGLIYWGVGNAAPDYNAALRPGDNLYSNSVVALDAATGKLAWHFQYNPSDDHDWDSTQTPALVDVDEGGVTRKLLAVANRDGFFYVLDRVNGNFVRGGEFAKQTWSSGLSPTGRPVRLPEAAPTPAGTYLFPSVTGATNWWPSAYSPSAQLYYVNVVERGGLFFSTDPAPKPTAGRMFTGGGARFVDGESFYGAVRALDPLTARVRWEHRLTSASPAPRGGLLATGGGLLFGSDGSRLYALDAKSGAQLWSFDAGGHISAPAVTYRLGGRQVVAVFAGSVLMTFALPDLPVLAQDGGSQQAAAPPAAGAGAGTLKSSGVSRVPSAPSAHHGVMLINAPAPHS
jgi:alcohol dehydrogenase (cytochrome c)